MSLTRERKRTAITYGERLRQAREAIGITQRKMADETGVRENTLTGWENGKTSVPPHYVERLVKTYGIEYHWIYSGDPKYLPHYLAVKIRSASSDEEKKDKPPSQALRSPPKRRSSS